MKKKTGKNGFLCNLKDSKDLALKMKNMFLMEAEQRAQMGAESRAYVMQNFDESIVINKYLESIERIK